MQSIPLVRESEATDERVREAFRDIKSSLRVPIVNLIFQAYAAVPKFLDLAWRRLRPSVLAVEFADLAERIGSRVRQGTEDWPVADHAAALRSRAVSEPDIGKMGEIVELFTQVNPKLVILASAVDVALMGKVVGGGSAIAPHVEDHERPKEFRGLRLQLVEERDAPPRVRSIYEDMKTTLGLPFIETEYRAMAAYPDWLEVWWRDCKSRIEDARYEPLAEEIAQAGAFAARALPHRLYLSDDLLTSADIDAAKRTELKRVNGAFMRLLPGLIVNVEIARRGLAIAM